MTIYINKMAPFIIPCAEGVATVLITNQIKQIEDAARVDKKFSVAMPQMLQGIFAFIVVNQAIKMSGRSPFSWVGWTATCLTPYLIDFIKKKTQDIATVQPVLTFFQDNLSNIFQVAMVVSSIALLFFGQTFFAASSLIILTIDFMDRMNWLPHELSQYVYRFCIPLLQCAGFIYGANSVRLMIALFAFFDLANRYFNRFFPQQNTVQNKSFDPNVLDPKTMQDFFANKIHFRINPKSIHYSPIAAVPNIDIMRIVEQFDTIDWSKKIAILRRKLNDMPECIQLLEQSTDAEIIALAKKMLVDLVRNVKDGKIVDVKLLSQIDQLDGKVQADLKKHFSSDKLHNYLKIFANMICNSEYKNWSEDRIIDLAVKAGGAKSEKYQAIVNVYAQTMFLNPAFSNRDKVLFWFQEERHHWIQQFFTLSLTSVFDWKYLQMQNQYANQFGLRPTEVDNGAQASSRPFTDWLIFHTLGRWLVQPAFWADHAMHNYSKTFIDMIGTSRMPQNEVDQFWIDWIESQPAELKNEFVTGSLYGEPLKIENQMNPKFVELMFFALGIAEVAARKY